MLAGLRTWRKQARLACIGLALWLPALASPAPAIHIVVPYAPGGALDMVARLVARYMFEGLDQPVVVDNRPGGDGTVATRSVVRSAADGRTLLIGSTALAVSAVTHALDYDVERDLQPVIKLASGEVFLAAHPGLNAQSIGDLKLLSALRPKGLNCAGIPGQTALACDRLARRLGGGMVTVPFQSLAPALNALVAGHVDIMFSPRAGLQALPPGQVVILAAATPVPAAAPYENLPLLKDTWPDMAMVSSTNIFVASGTPPPLVLALNREINRVLALPEVRSALRKAGYNIAGGGPEALAASFAEELSYYRQIVRETRGSADARR